jgi:hypothetical protein
MTQVIQTNSAAGQQRARKTLIGTAASKLLMRLLRTCLTPPSQLSDAH